MAQAVPFPTEFKQPNGKTIKVFQKGDEFLNWSEDTEGNLVVYDAIKKGFCYGLWTNEGPVSTGELVTTNDFASTEMSTDPTSSASKATVRTKGSEIPQEVRSRARRKRNENMPRI